jgi:hypothetical protein
MGGRDYAVVMGPQSSYTIKNAIYCPEFGKRLETNCIVVEPGAGNAELSYQIRKKQ